MQSFLFLSFLLLFIFYNTFFGQTLFSTLNISKVIIGKLFLAGAAIEHEIHYESRIHDGIGQTKRCHSPAYRSPTPNRYRARSHEQLRSVSSRQRDQETRSRRTRANSRFYLNVVTKRFARLDANARSTVDDSLQNDLVYLREFFKLTPALKVDKRKAKTSSDHFFRVGGGSFQRWKF